MLKPAGQCPVGTPSLSMVSFYQSTAPLPSNYHRPSFHCRIFQTIAVVMTRAPSVEQALRMIQDNPNGTNNTQARDVLQKELARIWRNIQDNPNSYVMDNLEFAVFNCHRNSPEYTNQVGQRAVKRYWDNRSG